jgi:hypothetical protein
LSIGYSTRSCTFEPAERWEAKGSAALDVPVVVGRVFDAPAERSGVEISGAGGGGVGAIHGE